MNIGHFLARDQEGNCYRILFERDSQSATLSPPQTPGPAVRSYSLEDGSAVRRLDNETFQVVSTGALVSLVRH